MRDKNVLAWKPAGGILVRAALTVRDQCFELLEEGNTARLAESSYPPFASPPFFPKMGGTEGGRAQPPADDGSAARLHPLYGSGRRKVARVGFHDQGIRIPIREPVAQPELITKIEAAAQEMNVPPQTIIATLESAGYCDPFPRPRQACEETHPSVTGGGEQIKKWGAIVGEHALLEREFAGEAYHAGICGACQAGDLCTWTTFHVPSRLSMTRLSLWEATFTPSGEAVLISRV